MNTCTYGGKEYSEGSEVCQTGRVMVCHGGNWGDTGRDCTESIPYKRNDDFHGNIPQHFYSPYS